MSRLFKAIILTALLYIPGAHAELTDYSAQQVRADIDAIEAGITATHPNPSHSVDPIRLKSALDALRRQARDGMGRDAVWKELSTINPLLADGHLFVTYPDWRGDTKRHLATGGTLFPFEVSVDVAGRVRVVSELGGAPTPLAGASVEWINGVRARDVAQGLLSRVHGESARFRADLLSKRWWFFYWKTHGAPETFDIVLDRSAGDSVRMAGSGKLPTTMVGEEDFERNFTLELRPDGAAVMTVRTFAWPDSDAFLAFTRRSFERMRDAETHTLLIDVRQNGGGDDAMWLQGLLPYIGDRPYRWASRYTKRVLKDNHDKHERAGDVLSGSVDTWASPLPEGPLRFGGEVQVLVGPGTYSSAVQFANTVQDFGFGTLVGEGDSVRAMQSGGIQRIALPNTGLVLWSPRFVLVRPSGKLAPKWLTPDIRVVDDPFDPAAMIEATLAAGTAAGSAE
jgi:hypothetical protein